MAAVTSPLPAARRQTYVFLEDARRTAHVHLLADVEATALGRARASAGRPLSYVSFVVKAVADVLGGYPEARAVLSGRRRPRLTVSDAVHAKVLFDKTVDGRRCVVSGIVPDVRTTGLDDVQAAVDAYKRADVDADGGPFARIRRLQRLPLPLIRLLYRGMMRDPVRAAGLQGTFAVTSVGHEPVRAILPMISGTLGLGVGQVAARPVVRDGTVVAAPVFTLSLVFDHRVIDGALAAEILAGVKHRLEKWEQA
ncbi:2-oxo acid dehydrogenase subunit E2 [Streptomyces sp. DSM 42041]|uniref:2-oxo acid dehydrogenase subunit E2 n=1 Tax=Streptomyces hazeniae TaxID=3075538 RepID=A0ABU2NQF7_9ACTN|nr:2-oxo acid dehydrogenase subunit E2 [Streptomyces sp. DSM 42041]MDT0378443.1 2-oxo acid dehydrogenase subunit E2 [Streptomyces sp. DSM 42041]